MEKEMKEELEKFAKAEYDVARYKVIAQVSRVAGSLLLAICLILVAFAVLAFCAAAAVVALAQCLPMWAACLIVGGVYLLLIPLLIACSKVLFVDPIVRMLSGLKNSEELKLETLRAESNASVMRERMSGRIRYARTIYTYYTQLLQTIWGAIRRLFIKRG